MIEEEYDPTSNEMTRHRSTEEVETEVEEQIISLDKCLQMFHDTEKLTDPSFCGKCKDHKEHQKSFEIFRPPPILTI
jgi:ubiquitin C-terminal hydrolase